MLLEDRAQRVVGVQPKAIKSKYLKEFDALMKAPFVGHGTITGVELSFRYTIGYNAAKGQKGATIALVAEPSASIAGVASKIRDAKLCDRWRLVFSGYLLEVLEDDRMLSDSDLQTMGAVVEIVGLLRDDARREDDSAGQGSETDLGDPATVGGVDRIAAWAKRALGARDQ